LAEIEEEFQSESINYKAMTSETETRITEIKREAYEFKRTVLGKGVDPRSNKIKADAVIKYYDGKIRAKDALVTKLQARNKIFASQIAKMESQLNNKNHSEETLSPIDFRQLMIENESFSHNIDSKNKALLKIKVSTAKMGQMLNEKRQMLTGLLEESVSLRKRIADQEERKGKLKKELLETKNHVSRMKKQCKKYKLAQTVSDMPSIEDYVAQKQEEFELRKKIKQWEVKVQLAQTELRRARAAARPTSNAKAKK